MRSDNWKIFDKKGSNLNQYTDSFLNLEFITDVQNATGATGYAITDPSAYISEAVISNPGWNYDPNTQAKLSFSFSDYEELLSSAEASIFFKDVSVYDPIGRNATAIDSINLDVSTQFVYPSVVFTSAVFMDAVSVDLIETEHISILEESSTGAYIRPYDPINSTLVFKFTDGDPEIKMFEVNQEEQILIWAEELIFDISNYSPNNPLIINIGFKAAEEGVFERKLRAYHRVGDKDFLIAEILVNSQSIGQDERFDTLAQNFGLPNSKDIPHLFKEADINEALPDWQLVNTKGKHMVIDHSEIVPFIGTYKGLINAIKWLGYEDIKIKEWFVNVKDNKKLSLYVPYEAADRTKTILYFSQDERKNLKKLNQLNLIYCITRETGEIDEWGNPLTEECYEYNITEVLTKLKSLKDWLEKNIIGVNARITDVTGEGVYFERFRNFIYATQDIGNRAVYSQSLTPLPVNKKSELITGEASVGLTLVELQKTKIGDFKGLKLKDLLQYYWDPSNGAFSESDASSLWWDPSTLSVGPSFKFPLYNLYDIQWKLSVEKEEAGVLGENFVTNPLFVYNNELRFYNILDSSTIFFDQSTNLFITIEKGNFRDSDNDIWEDSIAYSFYRDPDPSFVGNYIVESSTGVIWRTNGFISLSPDTSSLLQYAIDANQNVPLLSLINFKFTDVSGNNINLEVDKKFHLDLENGKIGMNSYFLEPSILFNDPSILRKEEYYINFNYDTSLSEQKITLNVVYSSPRAPLYLYDPSIYYNIGAEEALVIDNSIYVMNVNHIGPYQVEIFGWDGQNNVYRNYLRSDYDVWTKFPTIWSYLDSSCIGLNLTVCPSALLTVDDISTLSFRNLYPVFDRQISLQGLTLEKDVNGKYYINVPSISYFIDSPKSGSISKFYNMTERSFDRSGDIFSIDPDYQSFNEGDDVNVVLFNKNHYYIVDEVSGNITAIGSGTITVPGVPSEFISDPSTDVYFLNNTLRNITNPFNDMDNGTLDLDISAYRFRTNQLVGVIIEDSCTGYSWGSSFRVLDSSITEEPEGFHHQLKGNIPQFILDNSTRYNIQVKHSISSFVNMDINVDYSEEVDNNFHVYLEDYYYQQYYLDSTFVYVNVLFDQELVLDQWYDPSTDGYLVTGPFYPYAKSITVDISTLVILDAFYEPSSYMLNQKNIWTVKEHNSDKILFKVFNESIPFIFTIPGIYDVTVEAYDKYGNLKIQTFDGLIEVK